MSRYVIYSCHIALSHIYNLLKHLGSGRLDTTWIANPATKYTIGYFFDIHSCAQCISQLAKYQVEIHR